MQEALDEQSEREKLRANETQELQKSLKELQVNYDQLRAEKHTDTLGNTVREKIKATSAAQLSFAPLNTKESQQTDRVSRLYTLSGVITHIENQLNQSACDNIATLRAQLQVAEAESATLNGQVAEYHQNKQGREIDHWLRNNPVDARSLADMCSTKADAEGGSSAKVCGIDSASSRVNECNTNATEAFTPADGENSSGNKPGFGRGRVGPGQRGRGGGHTSRRSFEDDSDEEAYTTPALVQSNAHSPYAAGVCKSISFENN